MPISLANLCKVLVPEDTTLLLGSGASIPSNAPSVGDIIRELSRVSGIPSAGYTLPEFAGIFEKRRSRKELISVLRALLAPVSPNAGVVNIANYDWRAIHTTNYDTLVEKSFDAKHRALRVYSSNFDFGGATPPGTICLYKFHGTIDKDISDGHNSRIIITLADYEIIEGYREKLYDQLRADINNSDLLIIGHSLADEDLKRIIRRSLQMHDASSGTSIYLLLFSHDEALAELYEDQRIRVCFGGIDDFFLELAKAGPSLKPVTAATSDLISRFPVLAPTTIDVAKRSLSATGRFSAVYAGAACDYADIRAGFSFERSVKTTIKAAFSSGKRYVTILGASGVGKTTLARQVALDYVDEGWHVWEHNPERALIADEWRRLAKSLSDEGRKGLLILDDAHHYLSEVNVLVDQLVASRDLYLHILVTSARNHWKPRFKSANLVGKSASEVIGLTRLDVAEIGRLLQLVTIHPEVSKVVDLKFKGFSHDEKQRRLMDRCGRDFFVCMKNIFANENFNIIILREFAAVSADVRDVYKYVCALETLGVVVHRQVIIRLLSVPASGVARVLEHLEGLVSEYEIDRKNGIYGWKGRHHVISEIISNSRFSAQDEILALLRRVVLNIAPTSDVDIRTLRQLCSPEMGIRTVTNVDDQNELLRILISTAPQERVPRHRLISNLLRKGSFPDAETEIRVFEQDLGLDGPVRRYKVRLSLGRALNTTGLLPEDKVALLNKAYDGARNLIDRTPEDIHTLRLFGDVAIEIFRVTGAYEIVDEALELMRAAEGVVNDPDITRLIRRFESRIVPNSTSSFEFVLVDDEDSDDQ